MPFENGYPVGDSIKPALYINDPAQTHDLIQVSIPLVISQWLYSLMDNRHHFHGLSNVQDAYIIERYTEEDYAYAYDFSLKLYEFYKELSTLYQVISPSSSVGQISGLNFGNRFENLESIDNTPYDRSFDDILKINLPNTENDDDWVTITFYETLPWIEENHWFYADIGHVIPIDRNNTLLTRSDIALLEIPDSRTNNESAGSRIPLPVEDSKQDRYIEIEYNYRFHNYSTEGCIIDPETRRYNLINKKYKVVGQEIIINTRWLVAYTMVINSNNSSVKDNVIAQISEQYLYQNLDAYLSLLKTEIDNQYISKKILTNLDININFNESLNLSQSFSRTIASDNSGFNSEWNANHSMSVSYSASNPSLAFVDINPEAHYFGNLIYANNNLYNNEFGDTSSYQDLGIGLHIRVSQEKEFILDNGRTYTISSSSLQFGAILSTSVARYNIYAPYSNQGKIINTGLYQKRNDHVIETNHSEEGKYTLTHDESLDSFRNLNAYQISYLVAPLLNSSLYSEAKLPTLVYADLGIQFRNLPEGGYGFAFEPLTIKIERIVSLDNGSGEDLSEISGERELGIVDSSLRSSASGEGRTFFGLLAEEPTAPDGFLYGDPFLPLPPEGEVSVDFSLNETLSVNWALDAYGTVRTTPQPRDFSINLAREEENIARFNTLFFEECSCMTAQVAQEILDLVREIHASLDSGKYAYQGDGETKRFANLGYLTERIARILGISVNPDGSIRSIRQSKLIETGDSIPAGWPLGQWGRNQGGSSVGQTGGKATEDRDGLAYAVRSNGFTIDPFTGEPNQIKEGGYVLVENIPQLIHIILDDLDRAVGLQNAGANVIPSPNGELIPIQGMNNILLQLLYTLGQTNKSATKAHISSLINQAIAKELLSAIGLPTTIKKLPVRIDENNKAYIPIPGLSSTSPSLMDWQLTQLINIAAILQGKIDYQEENQENNTTDNQ